MPEDKYCVVALAKEYCGDIEGTEDDLFIGALISAASRFIDGYTNCYWGPSATITNERVKFILGRYGDTFYTDYAPIISVSALADDNDTYVQNTDYVVYEKEGRIQLLNNAVSNTTIAQFSDAPGQLKITYVTGQGATKTGQYVQGIAAPEDVQLACAMIAGSWYQARDRDDISSKAQQNSSITYQPSDIPPKARAILDRRVRMTF